MIRIPVRDAENQEITTSINNRRIKIDLSYFSETRSWVISLFYNVQGELVPIVLSKIITINSPILGDLAEVYGFPGDLFIDSYYSTGVFDRKAFSENNYRFLYMTAEEKRELREYSDGIGIRANEFQNLEAKPRVSGSLMLNSLTEGENEVLRFIYPESIYSLRQIYNVNTEVYPGLRCTQAHYSYIASDPSDSFMSLRFEGNHNTFFNHVYISDFSLACLFREGGYLIDAATIVHDIIDNSVREVEFFSQHLNSQLSIVNNEVLCVLARRNSIRVA